MHIVSVDIADFIVVMQTTDDAFAAKLRQRYAEFLCTNVTPDVTINVHLVPDVLYIEPKPGPWVIESSISPTKLTYKSYREKGFVDLETRLGEVEMAPDSHIENFLRVVYAWLCVSNNALLLHAAGVIREGQGYVFFGPSGAGKTTTSRLAARQGTVLSDDLVIIREHEDGYRLYGVPFKGELSDAPRANQTAPLRTILRLRQARQHRLEPISTMTATAELAGAAPFVARDPKLGPALIDLCHHIARHVPVKALHFRRDEGFWKVIDEFFETIPTTASANGR